MVPDVGGRYFTEHRTLAGVTYLSLFGGTPTPTANSTGGNDSAFTPKFSIGFHPSPNGMFYLEASEGFRSGYIQSHATVDTYEALGLPALTVNPADTLWNFEAGEKWSFLSGKLYNEIALYDFIWDHAQLQYSPGGLGGVISIGNVRGQGVDLTLRYITPVPGLQLGLIGNANNTTLENVNPTATAVAPWFANGKQLPGTSSLTGTVDAEYRTPLPNSPFAFELDGRLVYRSKSEDSVTGRWAADTALFNLRAGIADGKRSLFLFVNNATEDRGPSSIELGRYRHRTHGSMASRSKRGFKRAAQARSVFNV